MKAIDERIVKKIHAVVDEHPNWIHQAVFNEVTKYCEEQQTRGIDLISPDDRTVSRYVTRYKRKSRYARLQEAVAKDKAEGWMWEMIEETNTAKAELIKEATAMHYLYFGNIPEEITLENARLIWQVGKLNRDMPAFLAYQVGTDYYHRRLLATYTRALAAEKKNEALVIDEGTRDLDNFIRLEPWRSRQHLANYIRAIDKGAVESLKKPGFEHWIDWTPMGTLPAEDYEPIYDEDGMYTGKMKRVQMDGKPYPPEDATDNLLDKPITKKAVEQVKESFRRFNEEFNKE